MVTCSLDALKKSSKRKGIRIKNGKKSRYYSKLYTVERTRESNSQDDEFLALALYLVARITLTLIFFSNVIQLKLVTKRLSTY